MYSATIVVSQPNGRQNTNLRFLFLFGGIFLVVAACRNCAKAKEVNSLDGGMGNQRGKTDAKETYTPWCYLCTETSHDHSKLNSNSKKSDSKEIHKIVVSYVESM